MPSRKIIMIIIVLAVGYLIGAKWPMAAQSIGVA